MRLCRLDLTRFGHFTDFSLDFGTPSGGKPDLHVIYGPNEAGKTTAFQGYLDLLFGVPSRSRYNFRHDYENMRVGGALRIDGEIVELVRIKRSKNDLLSPGGEPLNPLQLRSALDGIDRDQYRAMFSLDDETIEAGGDDILASQGNLGELVFSAAAGLSDLSTVLEEAHSAVEQFHKPRARKTTLAQARRRLQELRHEIRESDVSANAFRTQKEALDAARKRLTHARNTRDDCLQERSRIVTLGECLPLYSELIINRQKLTCYENYPSLPEGWKDEVRDLKLRQVKFSTSQVEATQKLDAERSAQNRLKPDTEIHKIADELAWLTDIPRSRVQTAQEDLPKREMELEHLEAEIAGLAEEIGLDDPESGVLPDARLRKIANIARDFMTATKQQRSATKEEGDARRRLDEHIESTESRADRSNPKASREIDFTRLLTDPDPGKLIFECGQTRKNLTEAERASTAANEELQISGDELNPELPLTGAEVNRVGVRWEGVVNVREEARRNLCEAEAERDRIRARLREFEKDKVVASDDEARSMRDERNDLWELHRQELSEGSALRFYQSMEKDDQLQATRFANAETLARLREIQISRAGSEAEYKTRVAQFKKADADLGREKNSIKNRMKTFGLPDDYDPGDLSRWYELLQVARERWGILCEKREAHDAASHAADEASVQLRLALGLEDPSLSLTELVRRAQIERENIMRRKLEAEARHRELESRATEVRDRVSEVSRVSGLIRTLKREWESEVSAFPGSLQGVEQFDWKVETLGKLASNVSDRDRLRQRIRAMKQDQDSFNSAIGALALRVEETCAASPLATAGQLTKRLNTARSVDAEFEGRAEQIESAGAAKAKAEGYLRKIDERMADLASHYTGILEIKSIDELSAALEISGRADQYRDRIEDLEHRILSGLGVSNRDDAMKILSAVDGRDLRERYETTTRDLEDATVEYERHVGDCRAASDALDRVGKDDGIARLEEKYQTLVLDIGEHANAALRLGLGILAAEKAISRYRDTHRSQMLADTERAFCTLTSNGYQGLRTHADGEKEVLLATKAQNGRSVSVREMSKGTRFQLYLALRLAGYRQYASGGTTLPFVADDILETFDNTRTSAALGLLREIATEGQALYFTHHEHVVELARETCGDDVIVHSLVDGERQGGRG